ncbi:MAG: potassium transporter [Arcicella sp.]|nr:potassium transporter [Arcicella sp.]
MNLRHPKKDKLVEAEENRRDLGFGTQLHNSNTRLLNRDGSFNVKREGVNFWSRLNIFNRLMVCSWGRFFMLVISFYLTLNFIFAGIYEFVGIENLQGADLSSPQNRFMDAFFFSSQTLTTVGYGRIAPIGFWASSVAAVESLMGLLVFALATSLLYGRFSKPVAHVLYSDKAIVAPYLDVTAFMFRVVNERANQLIDLQVEVVMSVLEKQTDGKIIRKYYGLKLERNKVNFFPTNWTIVHAITQESPMFGLGKEELVKADAEFLILIRATEDTFNQIVHSRTSYHAKEMVFGAKFTSMVDDTLDSRTPTLDLTKLSDYQEVVLESEYISEVKTVKTEVN